MRFDYQSPVIQFKSSKFRRFFSIYTLLIGLTGLLIHNTSKHQSNELALSEIRRPMLLSQTTKGALDLGHSAELAEQQLNITHKNIDTHASEIALLNQPHTIKDRWHTITVQVGDTLSKVFEKIGVSSTTLQKVLSSGANKKELYNIYPGQTLDFLVDDRQQLKEIKFNLSNTKALHMAKTATGFTFHYEEIEPTKKVNYTAARITGSLYATAQRAGLDDRIILQMADIFGCDIDFSLDIRDNDSFKVLYEEEYIRDQKISSGNILAVEFNNQGSIHKAVRFTDADGNSGYYSPEGYSLQKAFLRSPVVFTRISSHFSNARRHPILHRIRAHKGVDYAAPIGTPVKSAGDGRITFIGNKGGYGKSIEVTHGQKYSTFYAHLNNFAKNLKLGATVKQGQVIGYVGKTGLATGAHLHYEFRINGVHHNPVTVALPKTLPLGSKHKKEFLAHASNMLDKLNSHSQLAKR
jgi:murein DD-endopeptidase MepM/ murein hydrolase activator NlpD